MDEVYVSGALTSVADVPRARLFYELIAEIAAACGLVPYLPHRATDPVIHADLDPRSVYAIDRAHIERSALVIAYAGTPSFGVGIEVEIARERAIPVILVAERDAVVSRILVGSPAVVELVRFGDRLTGRENCQALSRPAEGREGGPFGHERVGHDGDEDVDKLDDEVPAHSDATNGSGASPSGVVPLVRRGTDAVRLACAPPPFRRCPT